jgi:hypothetical protein
MLTGMKTLARVMWIVALVWVILAILGAENFQELYGRTSGSQVFVFAFIIASIPTAVGWWPALLEMTSSRPPSHREPGWMKTRFVG